MVYLHHPPSITPQPSHPPVYPALFSLMVYPSAHSSYLPVYHMAVYLLAYASVHVDNSGYFPHPSIIYSLSVYHSSPTYSFILSSLCLSVRPSSIHHPSICLSIHHLSICLSMIHLPPTHPSTHLSSLCLLVHSSSIHPSSVHPAVYHQSVDLSIHHPSIIYLSVHPSI